MPNPKSGMETLTVVPPDGNVETMPAIDQLRLLEPATIRWLDKELESRDAIAAARPDQAALAKLGRRIRNIAESVRADDRPRAARLLNNLGCIFAYRSATDNALAAFNEALELAGGGADGELAIAIRRNRDRMQPA